VLFKWQVSPKNLSPSPVVIVEVKNSSTSYFVVFHLQSYFSVCLHLIYKFRDAILISMVFPVFCRVWLSIENKNNTAKTVIPELPVSDFGNLESKH